MEDILPTLATKSDLAALGLATKADITELRLSTTADIAELRLSTTANINELRQQTKSDITELRLSFEARFERIFSQMHKMDASLKTWMLATMIGLFFGFGGLYVATNGNGNRGASSTAPQAIVGNAPA